MGRTYIGSQPSKKSVAKMIGSISLEIDKRSYGLEAMTVVEKINSRLDGVTILN